MYVYAFAQCALDGVKYVGNGESVTSISTI